MLVDDLIDRLESVKGKYGGGWTACCPAHEDEVNSLSIDVGQDGRILLKCFAGCEIDAITGALDLASRDLFALTDHDTGPAPRLVARGKNGSNGHHPPTALAATAPAPVATATTPARVTWYDLRDAGGDLVARHKRIDQADGKRLSWWLPGATRPGLNGLRSATLPLYGSHHLDMWARDSQIVLVEGEKAADALLDAGIPAVGTVTGASACPSPEVLAALAGRRVVLWPDNDEPGRAHMQKVGGGLVGVAAELRWFTWDGAPNHGDAADWLALDSNRASLAGFLAGSPLWPATAADAASTDTPPPPTIVGADDLAGREFPPLRWIVPELLPEGLTILGGKAKMGKSWLVLGLAIAVAAGGRAIGSIAVEGGPVLYLALEDGPRRTQARLRMLLGEEAPPANLAFAFDWPALDEGGADALDAWLIAHPGARLIVIDTLKRVRARESGRERLYDADYDAIKPLQELAKARGVAIVVTHHLRKVDADDPVDSLSGSTGLSASADGIHILYRSRGSADATLHVQGRDLPRDQQLALRWDETTALWSLVGDADTYKAGQERAAILEVLKEANGPVRPRDIADALERPSGVIRRLLWSMVRDDQVKSVAGGGYVPTMPAPPPSPPRDAPRESDDDAKVSRIGNASNALPGTTARPGDSDRYRGRSPSGNGNGSTPEGERSGTGDRYRQQTGNGTGNGHSGPNGREISGAVTGVTDSARTARTPRDSLDCRMCGQPTGSLLRGLCWDCDRALGDDDAGIATFTAATEGDDG